MAYADLAFRTGKEEEDFLAWLWNTPFSGMSPGSVLQKDVQWDRVLDLFRTLNKPEHQCYSSSSEDLYGDLLAEFNGDSPEMAPLNAQLDDAKNVLRTNVQLGVSRIMRLARKEYPEAMALAADFYFFPFFFDADEPMPKVSFSYASRAVEAGFEGGLARLAYYLYHGIGTRKSPGKAKKYLDLALASSHPGNYRYLALFLGYGEMVEAKPELAEHYIIQAMESDILAFQAWNRLFADGLLKAAEEPQAVVDQKVSNPLFGYALGRSILNEIFAKDRKPEKEDRDRLKDAAMWIRESAGYNVPLATRLFYVMCSDRDQHELPGRASYRVCDICREALMEMEAMNQPEYSDPNLPFNALPLQ